MLFAERSKDKKLLVPFVAGGIKGWSSALPAFAEAGADAIEVGIPFSDAVMDGPTICEANDVALAAGITPKKIFEEVKKSQISVPSIAMTYYNIAYRAGLGEFATDLSQHGFSGAILADMPYEVAQGWVDEARSNNIATILLAAPTASDQRLEKIAQLSSGFIYAVSLLGVTGERKELAGSALEIVKRLKAITDTPVLLGVGISTPDQAAQACEVADGVVVGSALVRPLLEGKSVSSVAKLLGKFRRSID